MKQDDPNALWRWSARRLAGAIAAREVSATEALDSCLARMAQVNPALNAVVQPLTDEARAAAAVADAAVQRGEALGPLHGVPVTGKVLRAQAPMLAPPVLGLPGLSVPTGVIDSTDYATALGAERLSHPQVHRAPMGVQLIAGRFREDLCLLAGEAIEARAGVFTPVDLAR